MKIKVEKTFFVNKFFPYFRYSAIDQWLCPGKHIDVTIECLSPSKKPTFKYMSGTNDIRKKYDLRRVKLSDKLDTETSWRLKRINRTSPLFSITNIGYNEEYLSGFRGTHGLKLGLQSDFFPWEMTSSKEVGTAIFYWSGIISSLHLNHYLDGRK